MQLPPTILSLNSDRKRKNKDSSKPTPNSQTNAKQKVEGVASNPQANHHQGEDQSTSDTESSATDAPEEFQEVTDAAVSLSLNPVKEAKSTYSLLRLPRTLATTLFDRLEKMYGPSIKRMLTIQYRSVSVNNPLMANNAHTTFHLGCIPKFATSPLKHTTHQS